jgi:hypothetical protein
MVCQYYIFVKLYTFVTYFGRWSAAQDSGMDQARKFDVRDMTRGTVDTLEAPNRLASN